MKNLVLMNKELEINGFVKEFEGVAENNYYNPNTRFWCVDDELFRTLINLSVDNKLILKFNIFERRENIQITIDDFNIISLPPRIHLSKEQVLAKAIMESELNGKKLENQNLLLAKALMEYQMQNIDLGKKVNLLSKAVLELSLKK